MRCENPADAQLAGTYTVVGIDIELHIHGEWAIEVGFGSTLRQSTEKEINNIDKLKDVLLQYKYSINIGLLYIAKKYLKECMGHL